MKQCVPGARACVASAQGKRKIDGGFSTNKKEALMMSNHQRAHYELLGLV